MIAAEGGSPTRTVTKTVSAAGSKNEERNKNSYGDTKKHSDEGNKNSYRNRNSYDPRITVLHVGHGNNHNYASKKQSYGSNNNRHNSKQNSYGSKQNRYGNRQNGYKHKKCIPSDVNFETMCSANSYTVFGLIGEDIEFNVLRGRTAPMALFEEAVIFPTQLFITDPKGIITEVDCANIWDPQLAYCDDYTFHVYNEQTELKLTWNLRDVTCSYTITVQPSLTPCLTMLQSPQLNNITCDELPQWDCEAAATNLLDGDTAFCTGPTVPDTIGFNAELEKECLASGIGSALVVQVVSDGPGEATFCNSCCEQPGLLIEGQAMGKSANMGIGFNIFTGNSLPFFTGPADIAGFAEPVFELDPQTITSKLSEQLVANIDLNAVTTTQSLDQEQSRGFAIEGKAPKGSGSLSIASKSSRNAIVNQQNVFLYQQTDYQKFEVNMHIGNEKSKLTLKFIENIKDLPEVYDPLEPGNQDKYRAFFQLYGTHVVAGSTLGGTWTMTFEMSKTDYFNSQSNNNTFETKLEGTVTAAQAAVSFISDTTAGIVSGLKCESVEYKLAVGGGGAVLPYNSWKKSIQGATDGQGLVIVQLTKVYPLSNLAKLVTNDYFDRTFCPQNDCIKINNQLAALAKATLNGCEIINEAICPQSVDPTPAFLASYTIDPSLGARTVELEFTFVQNSGIAHCQSTSTVFSSGDMDGGQSCESVFGPDEPNPTRNCFVGGYSIGAGVKFSVNMQCALINGGSMILKFAYSNPQSSGNTLRIVQTVNGIEYYQTDEDAKGVIPSVFVPDVFGTSCRHCQLNVLLRPDFICLDK